MNAVLWLLQLLLGLAFLALGSLKLTRPREVLLRALPWVEDLPQGAVRAIGALEVLGALGVVLPAAVRAAPVLVPVAATGLALLALGAVATHLQRSERDRAVLPGVLLVVAVVVAAGRYGPWPLPA